MRTQQTFDMAKRLGRIPLRERTRELERIYYGVQREIAQQLSSVDMGDYRELKAMKVQERINSLIRKLNRSAIRWAKGSIPEAYKESYGISKTRLEILGKEKSGRFDLQRHKYAVMDYIDMTTNDLIRANMSIKNNVNTYLYLARQASMGLSQIQAFSYEDEEAINELIQDAIEAGERPGYATKLIRQYFQAKIGDGQFILINGRNYNLKYYARLVARTRMRKVQTQAIKNTCEQYENDLVFWEHHAGACDLCIPFMGQVYSLTGKNPNYPLLTEEPPIHPNCGCGISATSEEAIAIERPLMGTPAHEGEYA